MHLIPRVWSATSKNRQARVKFGSIIFVCIAMLCLEGRETRKMFFLSNELILRSIRPVSSKVDPPHSWVDPPQMIYIEIFERYYFWMMK